MNGLITILVICILWGALVRFCWWLVGLDDKEEE